MIERQEKMKCKRCGSTELTIQEARIPGDPMGGFRTTALCNNCLSIFVPELRANPLPSAPIRTETTADKPTIPFAIHSAIVDALAEAKEKHPHFADTDAEAGTVIAEELLEVNDAALRVMQNINDQASRDNLFVELAQLNAVSIRMMERIKKA